MAQDLTTLQESLRRKWAGRSFENLVSEATRTLMNARGDWDPPAGITPKQEPVRLAIGIPDSDTLPKDDLREAASRAIERPGDAAFSYGFGMGYAKLRSLIAERYAREKGLQVNEDWFQLTNGSAGAIDLICRTLIEPGDVIISESPTYMGTLRNFRGVLAEVAAVPMDEDGMIVDELEPLIERLSAAGKRIKLIYTISTFHNPTGATLSIDRRIRLLEIAAKHDILVLDDDAYGELYFEDQPPPSLSSLAGGYGVVTVGTLSKTLAPGLRIGWIHGEPEIVQLFGNMRFAMGLNQLMVRVIADYMEAGRLDNHIERARALYRTKMETLADALEHHAGEFIEFRRPIGGFYLWVDVNKGGLAASAVWRTAFEEGVAFTPGVNFFADRRDPDGERVRIAFPQTPIERMDEGARRFGEACRRVAAGKGA